MTSPEAIATTSGCINAATSTPDTTASMNVEANPKFVGDEDIRDWTNGKKYWIV